MSHKNNQRRSLLPTRFLTIWPAFAFSFLSLLVLWGTATVSVAAPISIPKTLEGVQGQISSLLRCQNLDTPEYLHLKHARTTLDRLLDVHRRVQTQAAKNPKAAEFLNVLFISGSTQTAEPQAEAQMDSADWENVQDFLRKNSTTRNFNSGAGFKVYVYQRLLANVLHGNPRAAAFEVAAQMLDSAFIKLERVNTEGVYFDEKLKDRQTDEGYLMFEVLLGGDGLYLHDEKFRVTFDSMGNSYLVLGQMLGTGWGKVVDLVYSTADWKALARAVPNWNEEVGPNWEIRKSFLREAKIFKELKTLPPEARCHLMDPVDASDAQFFMPLYHGELFDQFEAGTLTPAQKGQAILDIADGLEALHSKNLVYKDLKLENVFVNPVKGADGATIRWQSVCADFGLGERLSGCVKRRDRKPRKPSGSPDYFAPELFKGWLGDTDHEVTQLSKQADVFSLGVATYMLLEGYIPFPGKEPRPEEAAKIRKRFKAAPTLYLADLVYWSAFDPDPRTRVSLSGFVSLFKQVTSVERTLDPTILDDGRSRREPRAFLMEGLERDLGKSVPRYTSEAEMRQAHFPGGSGEVGAAAVWILERRGGNWFRASQGTGLIAVSFVNPTGGVQTKLLADLDDQNLKGSIEVNLTALRQVGWIK